MRLVCKRWVSCQVGRCILPWPTTLKSERESESINSPRYHSAKASFCPQCCHCSQSVFAPPSQYLCRVWICIYFFSMTSRFWRQCLLMIQRAHTRYLPCKARHFLFETQYPELLFATFHDFYDLALMCTDCTAR